MPFFISNLSDMNIRTTLITLVMAVASMSARAGNGGTLRTSVGRQMLIGAAVEPYQLESDTTAWAQLLTSQFNAVVGANCMKADALQPREGEFRWAAADAMVSFAQRHDMAVIGHCLVWHSQCPRWMFRDADGLAVSRDNLIRRMRRHIHTVVGHFRGRVRGWDVVNEAIGDDGQLRPTPYLQIIGPEYISLAFRFAHEADPEAELYYNDYSMANPRKRAAVCRLVRSLRAEGLRIDAVGMQSHNGLNYPSLSEYETTIDSLAACGVRVMITELDINVLPNPRNFGGADISQHFQADARYNPYTGGLPQEVTDQLTRRYMDFFNIYYRHRHQISRINLWGVSDADSWLNNFPIHGRTNYPLLFDRSLRPKPAVAQIIQLFSGE